MQPLALLLEAFVLLCILAAALPACILFAIGSCALSGTDD